MAIAGQRAATLPGLQILRGLAASLVLAHHVLEESQPLFGGRIPSEFVLFGASGVDLFFAISGFIMYYSNSDRFGRQGASYDFFVRRLIRITPLYWLCTLAIASLWLGGLYKSKVITWLSLGESLLFLPNANIVLGAGWTLNFELYFYAIVAISVMLGRIRYGIAGVLSSIPIIFVLGFSLPQGAVRSFLTDPIALEFEFGFALAAAFQSGYLPNASGGYGPLLFGISGLVLGTFCGSANGTTGLVPEVRFLFWGVPAVAILTSALWMRDVETSVGRLLVVLGDASYSVYLTHGFVMTAYASFIKHDLLSGVPRVVCMLVPILISIAIGLITYQFIERPAAERLNAWWKKRTRSAAAPNQSDRRLGCREVQQATLRQAGRFPP